MASYHSPRTPLVVSLAWCYTGSDWPALGKGEGTREGKKTDERWLRAGGWGGEWGRRTPHNVLCTQLTTPTWNNGSFSEQHRQTQRHRPLLYVKQCVFHQPAQQVKEAPAGRGLTGGWQSRALTRLILHSAFVSTSVSTCVCVCVRARPVRKASTLRAH